MSPKALPITVGGVTYPSHAAAARAQGLRPEAFHKRLKRHQSLSAKNIRNRSVTTKGVTYPTQRAAAKALGISRAALCQRIKKGTPLDRPSEHLNPKGCTNPKGYHTLPKSITGRRGMLEHRFLMEKRLGRKLLRHETVHHKNGQRADNSDDNLELWSTSQPYGQRVVDKIEWAKTLLALYKDFV